MDITVILPIHKLENEDFDYLRRSLTSYLNNQTSYSHGKLKLMIIASQEAQQTVTTITNSVMSGNENNYSIVINDGDTDFCSQINTAVKLIDTEFFSILEMDDEYSSKWFNMAYEWYETEASASVFLPINVQYNEDHTKWQFGNELVWASSFSNELGVIDFECLDNCSTFNLTGGIFNTSDFIKVGGLKPSIKIAFNYEFLLRATDKKLKVIVVPKEGYKHLIGRKGSLTSEYEKTISDKDVKKWFELAKCEYPYVKDRKKKIISDDKKEILK